MWLGSGRIEVLFVLEFSYLGRSFGEMVTGISEVNEGRGRNGWRVSRDMEEMVYHDLFRMVYLIYSM